MNPFDSWSLNSLGPVSNAFLKVGVANFDQALRWVHSLPYGRNSAREYWGSQAIYSSRVFKKMAAG